MNTPKHSLETEHEVLETIMHFSEHTNLRVQNAMLKINMDCFYNHDNKQLFRLIRDCFNAQQPFHFVDILVLIPSTSHELHDRMTWLIDNYGKCHAGESNFEHYIDRLITLSQLRKQLMLAENMIQQVIDCASPEESQALLTESITEISRLNYRQSNTGQTNIDFMELYYDGKIEQDIIIPTRCDQINQALGGGIRSKMLITIGGKPSHGKTGFGIYFMDAIASQQPERQSLFFSLEMESRHIWMRHLGIRAGKTYDKMTKEEREEAMMLTAGNKLTIFDCGTCPPSANIDFILTTTRLKHTEQPVSVIVVDYLALVQNKGNFERHDLMQADISSRLGQMAMELDCTVILLTQVNRASSQRSKDDQCPYASDASNGSGSENSSGIWIGIDRPEIYREEPEFKNQFVVKFRKNRFGENAELIYAFNSGTFGTVHPGYFKKPMSKSISPEKTVFSGHSEHFYKDK